MYNTHYSRQHSEYLESVQGLHASLRLVGYHSSHSVVENATGGTEMERPTLGVHVATQLEVLQVFYLKVIIFEGYSKLMYRLFSTHYHRYSLTFVSIKAATDVQIFTSYNNNPLPCISHIVPNVIYRHTKDVASYTDLVK